MSKHFADPNHALNAGMMWGLLMRQGLDALPEVDDDGDYTDVIKIEFEGKVYRVRVLA